MFVVSAPGVLANDLRGIEPDGTAAPELRAVLVSGPRLIGDPGPFKPSEPFGQLTLKEDGSLTYVPPKNFHSETNPFNPALVQFSYRLGTQPTDPTTTATLCIEAVNDQPIAFGGSTSMTIGTTSSKDISVPSGVDVETASTNLQYIIVRQPDHGSVTYTSKPTTFRYIPPKGGIQKSTFFQIKAIDRGSDAGFGESTRDSAAATVSITATIAKPTLISKTGILSKGYLNNATVLFDANFNGLQDTVLHVDPDSGESISVDEPTTNTRADGSYELEIPVEFDRNGDGRLSDAEGRIVILGGSTSAPDCLMKRSCTAVLNQLQSRR